MGVSVRLSIEPVADLMAKAVLNLSEEGAYRRLQPGTAQIVNFFDIPTGSSFDVPPEQALAYFKAKGLKPTFSYADMAGKAHDSAFTVAKMMDVDLLGQVQSSLDSALANGTSFAEWKDNLLPMLQAAGWWGRKEVVDPLSGKAVVAQLGSPSRLETIFRTNMQTSYAAQKWTTIDQQAEVAPYLMYDAIDDFRTRPLHRLWDNTVLPVTSPWWKTHYPPCGYNCRCGVLQLSHDELDALGLHPAAKAPDQGTYTWTNPRTGETQEVPLGIDPGFDRNVGVDLAQQQQKILAEKAAALPAALKQQAEAAVAKLTSEAATAQQAVASAAADAALARAQAKIEAKVQEAAAAAAKQVAQKAAKDEIAAITSGTATDPGSYLKQAVTILKKGGTLPADPEEALAAIKQQAAAQKDKQKVYAAQTAYKKAILEGKTVPPGAVAVLKTLPDDVMQAFVDKVDALLAEKIAKEEAKKAAKLAAEKKAAAVAKMKATKEANKAAKLAAAKQAELDAAAEAKAAAEQAHAEAAAKQLAPADEAPKVTTGDGPDISKLTQIGGQSGSNPGGLFQDTSTGQKWYVKTPPSPDAARNEVLTAKLYELAGVDVPEVHLVDYQGQTSIASKIVDDLAKGTPAQLAKAGGTAEGFATDAWLANWDVVGLGYDNLLLKGGRAIRVDTGAGLRYRAQGGMKGAAFGDTVGEIDSLRDPSNKQAASVFGKLSQQQLEASVARVLAIPDADIRAAVALYGPESLADQEALANRLIARKIDLEKRFPNAVQANEAPPAPVAAPRVTDFEQQQVIQARANGYGFKTDGGAIEDQMVTVNAYTDAAGKAATRAWMKLRPEAAKALLDQLGPVAKNVGKASASAGPSVELAPWRDKVLEALKGINSRASKGEAWEAKDVQRLANARQLGDKLIADLKAAQGKADAAGAANLKKAEDQVSAWQFDIELLADKVKVGVKGTQFAKQFPASSIPGDLAYKLKAVAPKAEPAPAGVQWVRRSSLDVEQGKFDRGNVTMTGATARAPGVSELYEGTLPDGGRIRFVADTTGNSFAMRGVLYLDLPGVSAEASARAFTELEKIGVAAQRATGDDRDNLYLNAFARLKFSREASTFRDFMSLEKQGSVADAVKAKLAFLKKAGLDVEASQGWKLRDGVYQAFGHGRAYQLRPDLDTADFAKFAKEGYTVYRNYRGLSIAGDSSSGTWAQLRPIVESGGQSLSQTERIRIGAYTGDGSSVSSDFGTGGASYLFTRVKPSTVTQGTGVYWKPDVLKRMDAISYSSDKFGDVTAGSESDRYGQSVADFRSVAKKSSNETIYKNGLSLFDGVEKIVLATKSEVATAIKDMKSLGYAEWPDGRPLEDVFKVYGSH